MKISFKHNLSGMGDELALTPVVREIRRRHPNERIDVGARLYREIWDGNPYLVGGSEDKLGGIEIDTRKDVMRSLPVQFARQMGVEIADDRPEIYLTAKEIAEDFGIKDWSRTIAIDVYASAVARRWPGFPDAIGRLEAEGWRVVEVGRHPGAPQKCFRSFLNKLSIRQTAAVLSRCSLYLGNDSGLMHLAAAVLKPQVAIYSTGKWQQLAYWNTVPVQATCRCHFGVYACDLMGEEKPPACLGEVSVDRVMEAAHLAIGRFRIR